jgi:hypothetical protein
MKLAAAITAAFATAADAFSVEFSAALALFKAPLAELSAGLVGRPVSPALFDTVPPTDAALSACHHHELDTANISSSAHDDVTPCDNARYFASLRALSWQIQGSPGGVVDSLATVDTTATTYSQIFVDFIEVPKR